MKRAIVAALLASVAVGVHAGKLDAVEERLLRDVVVDSELTPETVGQGVQPFQWFYADKKGMEQTTAGGLSYWVQTDFYKQKERLGNSRILVLGTSQGVDQTVFYDPGFHQFYLDGDFQGQNIGFVFGVIRKGENLKALQALPENIPVVLNCRGLYRYKQSAITKDCRFLNLKKVRQEAYSYAVESVNAGRRFEAFQTRMYVRGAVQKASFMTKEEKAQCLKSKSVPCYKDFWTDAKIRAVESARESVEISQRFKDLKINE